MLNGCPVITVAAISNAMKLLKLPHWPLSKPQPQTGISFRMVQRFTGRGSGSPCANMGGSCGCGSANGGSSSRSGSGSDSDGDADLCSGSLAGSGSCFSSDFQPLLQSSGCSIDRYFWALRSTSPASLTFGDIASTDTVGMLLEQGDYLLNAPAAAEIMPNNSVKCVAAVGAVGCALPHNLVDFI